MQKEGKNSAFTLIELIVVIAVVVVLLAIIVPTLTRVKERARRIVCQNNMRAFHISISAYAVANDSVLPACGLSQDKYIITMLPKTHDQLNGPYFCPNLINPFRGKPVNVFNGGSYQNANEYFLLGYNYLAGCPNTPWPVVEPAEAAWVSPLKSTGNPRLPVITELNTWISKDYQLTFAPHGYFGPIHESGDSTNQSLGGIPSKQIGAAGGNICTLDGAINWKDISDMQTRMASSQSAIKLFACW